MGDPFEEDGGEEPWIYEKICSIQGGTTKPKVYMLHESQHHLSIPSSGAPLETSGTQFEKPDLHSAFYIAKALEFLANSVITVEKAEKLCGATVKQSKFELWHDQRIIWIPSTSTYSIF